MTGNGRKGQALHRPCRGCSLEPMHGSDTRWVRRWPALLL